MPGTNKPTRQFYLVESCSEFTFSKLPKSRTMLYRLLTIYSSGAAGTIGDAIRKTVNEVLSVWRYHFGVGGIDGKVSLDVEEKSVERL